MEKLWYLVAAYSIVWAAVFGYILLLVFRQRQLKGELDSVKESIEEKANR